MGMNAWTLTLEGRIPFSMNERERAHWATRKRELAEITTELAWCAKAEKVPQAAGKRFVKVTIHKSIRSRVTDDPANRDSRAKAPLDALVKLGLLVDDSDRWLTWGGVHEGERLPQKRTVIWICDADDEAAAA